MRLRELLAGRTRVTRCGMRSIWTALEPLAADFATNGQSNAKVAVALAKHSKGAWQSLTVAGCPRTSIGPVG